MLLHHHPSTTTLQARGSPLSLLPPHPGPHAGAVGSCRYETELNERLSCCHSQHCANWKPFSRGDNQAARCPFVLERTIPTQSGFEQSAE